MHSGKCKVWKCRVSSVELKRSREVRGGYGRLRVVAERENGEQWRKSRKKVGGTRRKGQKCQVSSVEGGVWSGKCRVWSVKCRV